MNWELQYLQILLPTLITVMLTFVGLFFGRTIQARHRRSIRDREEALKQLLVFNERRPPEIDDNLAMRSELVMGSVVLSDDAFTVLYANIRSIFGGRIGVYEALLDRARREALLRMKAAAKDLGASMIFNVRFETTNINQNAGNSALGAMEVLCYGTALTINGKL